MIKANAAVGEVASVNGVPLHPRDATWHRTSCASVLHELLRQAAVGPGC
jgi:hypothetical protein